MTGQITESAQPANNVTGYRSLFKNRQFMCLWIAQIFSQFADRAVFVLFVALLTSHVHTNASVKAAEMTSRLYIAFTIPAVVLSPVAGVYIDRWSNKAVLVISNLVRALCVCLVAFPSANESLLTILSLAFLISIGSQFFGPAETAAIPRLVKHDDLYSANSLFFTTMMIALGFGFAAGGPIIDHTGAKGAPWAVAAGFLIAASLLFFIQDNKRSPRLRSIWWEELRFSLAYIVGQPPVLRAIIKITILFSTIITLNIVAVGIAQQIMHIQPFQFGYIVAAAGLGMGLGNFSACHLGQKSNSPALAYVGFTGLGLFMSLMGSLGYLKQYLFPLIGWQAVEFNGWLMLIPLVLAIFIGISCAFVAIPTQAALQKAVPEDLRGKVFATQNTAMSATSAIFAAFAGKAIDNLPGGVATTLLIIGLPTFLLGAILLCKQKR